MLSILNWLDKTPTFSMLWFFECAYLRHTLPFNTIWTSDSFPWNYRCLQSAISLVHVVLETWFSGIFVSSTPKSMCSNFTPKQKLEISSSFLTLSFLSVKSHVEKLWFFDQNCHISSTVLFWKLHLVHWCFMIWWFLSTNAFVLFDTWSEWYFGLVIFCNLASNFVVSCDFSFSVASSNFTSLKPSFMSRLPKSCAVACAVLILCKYTYFYHFLFLFF